MENGNRTKREYFIKGVLSTVVVLLLLFGAKRYFGLQLFGEMSVADKMGVLEKYINQYFWKEVDEDVLEESALKGLVLGLSDKYSTYYTPEEYEAVLENIKGVYCGIGATMRQKGSDGAFQIVNVFRDSPAEKAGLKENDIVEKVNGESVDGLTLNELTGKVKGEEGTKVTLTILRDKKTFSTEVERKELKTISVDYKMVSSKIGYIDISEFDDETPKQFEEALQKLQEKGAKAFVFDVRNNGGGALTSVTAMLDQLLPEGLILSVRDKNGTQEEYSSSDSTHVDMPFAVLINGGSASASEVFAGSLQDRGEAILIGEKSFGKGIVQSIFSLKQAAGGGAIKLTTAEYFLPSGRSIHGVGLTPDIAISYEGEKDSYQEEKDNQLQRGIVELEKKLES